MSAAAAPDLVWIDGTPAATLSALDRGLHYGDGLFETMACVAGALRFETLHLARLGQGCERLGLPAPNLATLRAELAAACPDCNAVLKLVLTRGTGGRGYAAPEPSRPTRLLLRYPWPHDPPAWASDGVGVAWSSVPVGENPILAGIKHLNRLEQVLARSRLHADAMACGLAAAQEALMATPGGEVICGTMSNVFMVRDNGLLTPRVDRAGVAGVMRAVVQREAARAGIACNEARLTRSDFAAASELFVSNARIGIWPVRQLGERALPIGPVTRRLQQALAGMVA